MEVLRENMLFKIIYDLFKYIYSSDLHILNISWGRDVCGSF